MKKVSLIIFVLTCGAVVAGFMYLKEPTQTTTPQNLEPVSVQLKWLHQAQFAGNYVADEKGFYAENGIEITEMTPFDFVKFPISEVSNKNVDFGIAGGDELLLAKSKGEADDVKAIAVVFKTNPVALYSLKDSNITKPEDLIGKTVGLERATDGSDVNVGILYYAMMNKLNLNREQVDEVTIGYTADELLAGEVDVSSGYITNEPHLAIEAGKEIDTILVADYGVNMYADVIIAHEDILRDKPEMVESFLKATFDGWQYAIENETEAVDIVLQYLEDGSREHQEYMLSNSIPLIHLGTSPLGWMEEKQWQQAHDILLEQGFLDGSLDVSQVYTNEFIERIYNTED